MIKIDEIKSILNNFEEVLFAYLFGSYANGTFRDSSDVDIAIYLKEVSLDNELQINYQLSKFLKKDADTLVLNKVKNLYLLESIFKEGIVLKDNEKRLDFELMRQHDILDYKAFRKYIDAA